MLKVLLTNQISVYAVGVGSAAIPGYGQAQRIHLPKMGYGDILPKYASATGGEVFSEFSPSAIEQAYSRLTEEARNQYTIGYTTRATPSSKYRDVEVQGGPAGIEGHGEAGILPVAAAAPDRLRVLHGCWRCDINSFSQVWMWIGICGASRAATAPRCAGLEDRLEFHQFRSARDQLQDRLLRRRPGRQDHQPAVHLRQDRATNRRAR